VSDRPVLVDTLAAAEAVHRSPGLIRRWANLGLLDRQGADRKGRTLYDLAQVYDVDGWLRTPDAPR
jgi:hypothetical protein